MTVKPYAADAIRAQIGTEAGLSNWMLMDQDMMDRFALKDMIGRSRGQRMATLDCTIKIEGEDKPAVKAERLSFQFLK